MSNIFEYIELIMANNAVLGYLDLVWRDRKSTGVSFFEQNKSFAPAASASVPTQLAQASQSPPRMGLSRLSSSSFSISPIHFTDSPPQQSYANLPIHTILLALQVAENGEDADFFEPFVLHYWQLQRLLDVMRCSTPILALPATQRANLAKIKTLDGEIRAEQSPDKRRAMESRVRELELINRTLHDKVQAERTEMAQGRRPEDLENVQAVLVLSRLLNICFRKGMSVALLSDQLRLDAQQIEYRELLNECGITFDDNIFIDTFIQHDSVQTQATVLSRIGTELSEDIAWAFGDSDIPDPGTPAGALALAQYYVSRVMGTQDFHTFYTHVRLGLTRLRRELAFLEPHLQNKTYSHLFKAADPYMRAVLSYVNWLFFIPRLSLNFSLLTYHGLGLGQLEPLERKLDWSVRLQAHWKRCWVEVIPDLYWIAVGLKVCFWLPGGVLTPLGIALSVTVQALDLLTSILRAGIELHRLYEMAYNLDQLHCPRKIQDEMEKRFWFEAFALAYMVFHFSILMVSLCLTLPSMAAVSTMWPVIGGFNATLMTVITYHMQNYFIQRRQAEFEPRPKPLPSVSGDQVLPTAHSRRF
ncbi:MAG: hypothetical protein KBB94_04130 [Legionellaceae bacterium]|nr:hypothetical protein [Legionellaceae bacterium]MBP9774265.1 hypothetical protein [Legionellaceae bacterium]